MIKGLYAAASAMLANLTRQGALSHNIANLDTPGFKQVMVSLEDFTTTSVTQQTRDAAGVSSLRWLGDIGLGVEPLPEAVDFTQGGLQFTGQPLDLALSGNAFFTVETPNGERYTRDGRFNRDVDGYLVTVDGYYVLDDAGQRIELPEGSVGVSTLGVIAVDDEEVAQLGLAAFENPAAELRRDLPNVFAAAGAPTGETAGAVVQGSLEMANGSPAQLMSQMVAVTRAYEAAQQMVQTQDELLGKSISALGTF